MLKMLFGTEAGLGLMVRRRKENAHPFMMDVLYF